MADKTISRREFIQDAGRARRVALPGPAIVTNCGKPSRVLMSIERHDALRGKGRNLVDALSMPGLSGIDFKPHRVGPAARS